MSKEGSLSSNRVLSETEARSMLLQNQAGGTNAGWLNYSQKKVLLAAIEAKKEKFKFGPTGQEFKIVYYSAEDLVFVGPVKGFTPCGWFLVSKLRDRIAEGEVEEGIASGRYGS